MTFLTNEVFETLAIQQLAITDDTLSVDLSDGRTISVPLAWYPRLLHGSIEERNDYRLLAGGSGIHWNQLDEDISTKNLILGQPSGESQKSLKRWLNNRVRSPILYGAFPKATPTAPAINFWGTHHAH